MHGCICVYGEEHLNKNSLYSMETTLENRENGRDEMFSVRSRILKSGNSKATTKENVTCNGHDDDNTIGEESSGVYFARKLDEEEQRISKLCFTVQLQMWESSPPDEARGKIRAATGKARLLMTSKFRQLKDLCDVNAGLTIPEDGNIPTKADLEGFWDLVMLQIVDVDSMFSHLEKLRNNNWIEVEPENGYIKVPTSPHSKDGKLSPKKKTPQSRGNSPSARKSSGSKQEEGKKRQEARKRLADAKRAARKRLAQQSPTQDGEIIICTSPPKFE